LSPCKPIPPSPSHFSPYRTNPRHRSFFFIFSCLTELGLGRHRQKEKRFGPSPGNDYTSGYAKKKGGLLGSLLGRRGTTRTAGSNALPEHTHPDAVGTRTSYAATEATAVDPHALHSRHGADDDLAMHGYNKYAEPGYSGVAHPAPAGMPQRPAAGDVEQAHYPPANYRYDDGVYNTR
jgi:hypothetical protein